MTPEERKEQEEADDLTMAKVLTGDDGPSVVRWLKRVSRFDMPVFSADDSTGHEARLVDGGRHLVCEILNHMETYGNKD